MEASPDYSRLARTDELSVRKYFLEESLRACKEKVQIKAFQILADISDTAKIGTGMVIFYERWIEEIDNEMKSLA